MCSNVGHNKSKNEKHYSYIRLYGQLRIAFKGKLIPKYQKSYGNSDSSKNRRKIDLKISIKLC